MGLFRKKNILHDLGPLYHDFSFFGVNNEQLPGIYGPNQKAKFPIIMAYISYAIAKSKSKIADNVSFTELFCADGFFAMVAAKLGCNECYGVDNNIAKHSKNTAAIPKRLGLTHVTFVNAEIKPNSELTPTDIVANVGGLYHVSTPREILEMSYNLAKKFLIVQSVVSLANTEESYFESPAPGWTWGCRFSRESFDKMIKDSGFEVVDSHFNELEGNDRLEDRGSVYYLIKK
jgi:hypothetical protein